MLRVMHDKLNTGVTWQSLLKSSVAAPVRRAKGENGAFIKAALILWGQDCWNG